MRYFSDVAYAELPAIPPMTKFDTLHGQPNLRLKGCLQLNVVCVGADNNWQVNECVGKPTLIVQFDAADKLRVYDLVRAVYGVELASNKESS